MYPNLYVCICMYMANVGALPNDMHIIFVFNKCCVNFSLIHVFLL